MTAAEIAALEKYGWTVVCESPFELEHEDGSTATGQGAQVVLKFYSILENVSDVPTLEELEDYAKNATPDGYRASADVHKPKETLVIGECLCHGCPTRYNIKFADGTEGSVKFRWGWISLQNDNGNCIAEEQISDSMDGVTDLHTMVKWLVAQGYRVEVG